MTKTNFKCMYLIDDILYKDMLSKNRKSGHNLESNTPLHYQLPLISKDHFERESTVSLKDNKLVKETDMNSNQTKGGKNQFDTFDETELLTNTSNTEDMDCHCMDTQGNENDKVSGLDTQRQTVLNMERREADKSLHQQEMSNKSETYEQMDSVNQNGTKTAKKREHSEENYDDKQFNSTPDKGSKRKMGRKKRLKYSRQNENDSESDDEKEWEELRKRYYKLRYGSDEESDVEISRKVAKRKSDEDHILSMSKEAVPRGGQVQGTNQIRKGIAKPNNSSILKSQTKFSQNPNISNNDDIISFHCTLCTSSFKKFTTLSRHMKNIHGEYFQEWNRQNKRKNEEKLSTNKKFKNDGSFKRKASTDRDYVKRSKEEFQCIFCQRYFKSSAGLKRHTVNQHGSVTNKEKRKNAETSEERYLKRQKTKTKVPITYNSYF